MSPPQSGDDERTAGAYVLVVDDHPLFRNALSHAVGRSCPGVAVRECGDLKSAVAAMGEAGAPLLVLLDLRLPDADGFSALLALREQAQGAPVAVVTGDDGLGLAAAALQLGAAGFIPKSTAPAQMEEALVQLVAGLTWTPEGLDEDLGAETAKRLATLTPAQRKVLVALQRGLLNKQIAHEVGISLATVKAHVTAVYRKLGVRGRTQAVLASHRWL